MYTKCTTCSCHFNLILAVGDNLLFDITSSRNDSWVSACLGVANNMKKFPQTCITFEEIFLCLHIQHLMRAGQVNMNLFSGQVDMKTMQVKCVVYTQRNAYSFKVRFRWIRNWVIWVFGSTRKKQKHEDLMCKVSLFLIKLWAFSYKQTPKHRPP
jgi:hypothetical protein